MLVTIVTWANSSLLGWALAVRANNFCSHTPSTVVPMFPKGWNR